MQGIEALDAELQQVRQLHLLLSLLIQKLQHH